MDEDNDQAVQPIQLGPINHNPRGFEVIEFNDHYGRKCRLQQSSLALYETPGTSAVFFGVDTADGKSLAHITLEQVTALIAHLQAWASTGSFNLDGLQGEYDAETLRNIRLAKAIGWQDVRLHDSTMGGPAGFPPDAPQHTPGFLRLLPDFHKMKDAKEALLTWLAEDKAERWDPFEEELLEILGVGRSDFTLDLRLIFLAPPEQIAVAADNALQREW